ncbi:PD-(D/E)XK nuclease family protein [Shinella sp.]|uniref:PD-(D/E)XK nuclease family protein n=1 Tax=Shinella sp. TaxID=1870904 RepID=UPI004035161E
MTLAIRTLADEMETTIKVDAALRFDSMIESKEFTLLSSRFNRFCPFEATGMVRAEIRHGSFLAYMLDPRKPHGYGSRLLEAFLEVLFDGDAPFDAKGLLERNATAIEIRREWRDIDLMIVLPVTKTIIVFELKIDASQGKDQLQKYRGIVERHWLANDGWTHKFVFMTKTDEAAQDNWEQLRLAQVVHKFDEIAAKGLHTPARETLVHYISMMRRHHVGDHMLKDAARQLWAQHGEALDYLMRNRPNPLRQLFETLKSQAGDLAEGASTPGITVVPDEPASGNVRFGVTEWDAVPGFLSSKDWTASGRLVLFELKYGNGGLNLFACIGPSSNPLRKRFLSALLEKGVITKAEAQTRKWSMLNEAEVFKPADPFEFNQEEAVRTVSAAFNLFVARVFLELDQVMRPRQPE